MKKMLTLLLLFIGVFSIQSNAQQTGDEIFALDLKIDGVTTTYLEGSCSFSAPADWGGPITTNVCYPIVWGYTATDSLGCTALVGNYSGKLVMIRRGGCEFGVKALAAQTAGAAAVAIANNTSATAGDDCNAPGMGAGASGASVTTAPAFMFCRAMVNVIDAALKAGKTPEICIRLLSLEFRMAEYSYAVPLSQVDTIDLLSLSIKNRTGLTQPFTSKVTIVDPAGTSTSLTTVDTLMADSITIVQFDQYVPTPQLGKFKLTYSTDLATSKGDTLYREFLVTPHTFATDNYVKNGGISNNTNFAETNKYTAAALYKTGDQPITVKYATFGINNAATIATGNSDADVVTIYVHDADPDNNGTNDIGEDVAAFDALPILGFSTVNFTATTPVDSLLNVVIDPFSGSSIDLVPNHLYYLRLEYDGANAATGLQLSFSVSRDADYDFGFTSLGAITPIILGNSFFGGGWGGATVIARLQDKDFDPTSGLGQPAPSPLDNTKVTVSPNPTADFANVDIELDETNTSVKISLINVASGRIEQIKKVSQVKDGRFTFDTKSLPSGNYVVWVQTSGEGSRAYPLAICH
jgi:hypothetical protein